MSITLPGLVGQTEGILRRVPGVDVGLATGGALEVMSCVASGRCRVRAERFSPENRGVELWEPVAPRIALLGRTARAMAAGVEMVLRTIDETLASTVEVLEPPSPFRPRSDVLLVSESGQLAASGDSPDLPSVVVDHIARCALGEGDWS